jgi:hypothetical protein
LEGKITQVSNCNYLKILTQNEENYINVKLQKYNKMNGKIESNCGGCVAMYAELRVLSICYNATLRYDGEIWLQDSESPNAESGSNENLKTAIRH